MKNDSINSPRKMHSVLNRMIKQIEENTSYENPPDKVVGEQNFRHLNNSNLNKYICAEPIVVKSSKNNIRTEIDYFQNYNTPNLRNVNLINQSTQEKK